MLWLSKVCVNSLDRTKSLNTTGAMSLTRYITPRLPFQQAQRGRFREFPNLERLSNLKKRIWALMALSCLLPIVHDTDASDFYKLEIVAQSGPSGLINVGNEVSINDSGTI